MAAPRKYLSTEEGAALLAKITALEAKLQAKDATTSSMEDDKVGRLECIVYDGMAGVRMVFDNDGEAVRAINGLRRKVMTQGINVVNGGRVVCFRQLTRVVFSGELAQDHPILLK
mgnify:CR=1 FL=1|jgi:hypothetical protein|tara:strand:+ start:10041 stop:10385 length:345 start_codon:yes stop_codon:yes gene_type:complete